jgi:hypothetical protein
LNGCVDAARRRTTMIAKDLILPKDFNRISVKILRDHSADMPTPVQPCNWRDLRGSRDWSSAAPPPEDAPGRDQRSLSRSSSSARAGIL